MNSPTLETCQLLAVVEEPLAHCRTYRLVQAQHRQMVDDDKLPNSGEEGALPRTTIRSRTTPTGCTGDPFHSFRMITFLKKCLTFAGHSF